MAGVAPTLALAPDCGRDLLLPVVVSGFDPRLSQLLVDGALQVLQQHAVSQAPVHWVPGAFELPTAAQRLIVAGAGRVDAVICLGTVIRGDTPHFDMVTQQAAAGIMRVALDHDVPVLFGVLTCDTLQQAESRCGLAGGSNRGAAVAQAALHMANWARVTGVEKGNDNAAT